MLLGGIIPRQLFHLIWWNNTRLLAMRGRQEHFNCKVKNFTDRGIFYEYTEHSTKRRTEETDNPKARRKHNNKIFQGKGGESDPYLALKKYLSHRPVRVSANFICSPSITPEKTACIRSFHLRETDWPTS